MAVCHNITMTKDDGRSKTQMQPISKCELESFGCVAPLKGGIDKTHERNDDSITITVLYNSKILNHPKKKIIKSNKIASVWRSWQQNIRAPSRQASVYRANLVLLTNEWLLHGGI